MQIEKLKKQKKRTIEEMKNPNQKIRINHKSHTICIICQRNGIYWTAFQGRGNLFRNDLRPFFVLRLRRRKAPPGKSLQPPLCHFSSNINTLICLDYTIALNMHKCVLARYLASLPCLKCFTTMTRHSICSHVRAYELHPSQVVKLTSDSF